MSVQSCSLLLVHPKTVAAELLAKKKDLYFTLVGLEKFPSQMFFDGF